MFWCRKRQCTSTVKDCAAAVASECSADRVEGLVQGQGCMQINGLWADPAAVVGRRVYVCVCSLGVVL
jgi:hypothetical protein